MSQIERSVKHIIETTTKNLIQGKYRLIEIGKHCSKLEYRGEIIDIWIANGVEYCKIHNIIQGLEFPEFGDNTKSIVYKIATTPTPYLLQYKLKLAKQEQKIAYAEYKAKVNRVKEIKAEQLESLKA